MPVGAGIATAGYSGPRLFAPSRHGPAPARRARRSREGDRGPRSARPARPPRGPHRPRGRRRRHGLPCRSRSRSAPSRFRKPARHRPSRGFAASANRPRGGPSPNAPGSASLRSGRGAAQETCQARPPGHALPGSRKTGCRAVEHRKDVRHRKDTRAAPEPSARNRRAAIGRSATARRPPLLPSCRETHAARRRFPLPPKHLHYSRYCRSPVHHPVCQAISSFHETTSNLHDSSETHPQSRFP